MYTIGPIVFFKVAYKKLGHGLMHWHVYCIPDCIYDNDITKFETKKYRPSYVAQHFTIGRDGTGFMVVSGDTDV